MKSSFLKTSSLLNLWKFHRMKILHTADWHIGKKLYGQDLKEEFLLFIDWLTALIVRENVEVILICGDIFDLSNPSSEAKSVYYHSLLRLYQTGCKIIIIGGNHDSANGLNAPKDLMKPLDIHIIGGLPENHSECYIPVMKNNSLHCVIAAIPFLKDSDFRRHNDASTYENRIEIVQKGIEQVYQTAFQEITEIYGNTIPIIAMGHLFTAGAVASDSEREIQIGNQALFDSNRFSSGFSYIALGHIHKPQRIKASVPVFYSGSPIPLSFSERQDSKRVLLIDTSQGFEPQSITIPCFRKLIRIKGNWEKIVHTLNQLKPSSTLTSFIEIELQETFFDVQVIQKLEDFIANFQLKGFQIIHHSVKFHQQSQHIDELYEPYTSLAQLHPQDVFEKLIESQTFDTETQSALKLAFQELLEEEYHDNP